MRLGTLLAGIVVMAIGFGVYSWQAGKMGGAAGGGSPTAIIDTIGVKTDLLSMAGAQRQQFALEGRYLSLEELRARGVSLPEGRGAYVYSAVVTDMDFTIKATHVPKNGETAQPTMSIGPDMQVK